MQFMVGSIIAADLETHVCLGRAFSPCGKAIVVAKSCLTFCDPMDCSTLGFPVHHGHLEFAQIHVHCVGDAI